MSNAKFKIVLLTSIFSVFFYSIIFAQNTIEETADYENTDSDIRICNEILSKYYDSNTTWPDEILPSNKKTESKDDMFELLFQFNIESITLNNRNVGVKWFNGKLWITDANQTLGNKLHEIDPFTGTLLNSYPQGTTSSWGMRDMADDGTYLYAGDENGFYKITSSGSVTTLFDNTAPIFSAGVGVIRALAWDGSYFWTKSYSGDLYKFDVDGNVLSQYTLTNSTYGMAYDHTVPCLWLHATGGPTGNEMVQVDLSGVLTGVTIPVPIHPCGPGNGNVGGAFLDFGDMISGKYVFGILDQNNSDLFKVFEAYEAAFPDQTSNHVPACYAVDVATTGELSWNFGDYTDTYDVWFGPVGAIEQVVSGAPVGVPIGSYSYSDLEPSNIYEWRVDGHNSTIPGSTTGLTYSFTTICSTFPSPFNEGFEGGELPVCWIQETNDDFDWTVYSGPTLSSNTGPSGAAEGNYYIYCESSGANGGEEAALYTPDIDLSTLTCYRLLYFRYHMYGDPGMDPDGTLTVDITSDNGLTWNNLFIEVGNQGNQWNYEIIDISAYTGVVKFAFTGIVSSIGTSYQNDFALDAIDVSEAPACPSPYGLITSNITQATADIDWICVGVGTNWEYDYGSPGYGPPVTAGTSTTTKPVTLTGLTPSTDYEWWVRTCYDVGIYSSWVGPKLFSTLFLPPLNDDCVNAQLTIGPFPINETGTTNGAVLDCPGILDWNAVWYEIDLPYEYNYVQIDLCQDDIGTNLNNTGKILTTDCSCDFTSFIYSDSIWFLNGNCINDLNFNVSGPGWIYFPVMVDPQGDFTLDIDVSELYGINGTITYANSIPSPMVFDEVTIDDGTDIIISTTLTDQSGYYHFGFVPSGSYTLDGSTTDTWGGLSMNDVQLARQYVTNQPPGNLLSGLHLIAGDVDLDGNHLMNDIQAMRQELTFNPPGFTPFWIFDNPNVTVGPSVTQDFQVICGGDTDGSYIPSSK